MSEWVFLFLFYHIFKSEFFFSSSEIVWKASEDSLGTRVSYRSHLREGIRELGHMEKTRATD